jgi:hypothetical protein
MKVDIVGEDEVTRAVIMRIIKDFRQDIIIDKILPARGGQLKTLAPKYNRLNSPIILLTDLDVYDCPPSLLLDWFQSNRLNPNLLFRIAYGETESWLMSDRKGFSEWIESEINLIPYHSIIDKRKGIIEIVFPYKPSLYLMREIAVHSKNKEKREALIPLERAKKGPLYNSILIAFIEKHWNISNASINSTSLTKAIQRIKEFK